MENKHHFQVLCGETGLFEPANRRSLTLPHSNFSDADDMVAIPTDRTVGNDVELKGKSSMSDGRGITFPKYVYIVLGKCAPAKKKFYR